MDAEVGKDPVGNIDYPIIDLYHGEPKVVGMITMFTHWRSLFLDLLPEAGVGVDAVFSSTCGGLFPTSGNFTYQINGPRAEYRGAGDLHDPKYDYMGQEVNIVEAFNERLASGTQYKGAPLSYANW